MDKAWSIITGICAMYGAILATYNFLKDKNDGQITNKGVISPNGENLIEKQKR
jgi:hypothetical protein